jgi:hypothetical protein
MYMAIGETSGDKSLTVPRSSSWAQHRLFPAASALVTLLVYLAIAWLILAPRAIWSPDEGAKLLQVQNLRLIDQRFAYDIAYPGRALDPELRFAQPNPQGLLRVRDSALYFQRLPVFPLLVLPLFQWFGLYGLYLAPAIGGAASVALALQLVEPCDRRVAMWPLIAFGSPILIYAITFWEHTLATGLGLFAAWLALRLGDTVGKPAAHKVLGWAAVGLLLAAGAYLRLELLIFGLALLAAYWLLAPADRLGPLWAGAMLAVLMLPYVPLHQIMFGQSVADNALYLFYPFLYLREANWRVLPDLLIGPWTDGAVYPGWSGTVWAGAAVLVMVCGFVPHARGAARVLWTSGIVISTVAATMFLFSSADYRSIHGLLFAAPWALLGMSRAREIWQRGGRRARVVVLTTLLGLAGYLVGIVVLRASSPHGGLEWGARFALTFYPLLALIAAWDLGRYRHTVVTAALIGVLMLLGPAFQLRGVLTIYREKQTNVALYQALTALPESNVVTDLWWMPLNTAPLAAQKAVFVAATPQRLHEWVQLAAASQVRQFCLVTLDDAFVRQAAQIPGGPQLTIVAVRRVSNILVMQLVIESS